MNITVCLESLVELGGICEPDLINRGKAEDIGKRTAFQTMRALGASSKGRGRIAITRAVSESSYRQSALPLVIVSYFLKTTPRCDLYVPRKGLQDT